MLISLVVSIICIIFALFLGSTFLKKAKTNCIVPGNIRGLLAAHVVFYNNLGDSQKLLFEKRVKDFLANIAIKGVDTEVEDIDRVLVAAGGIIPIFAFPDWRYNNLSEVLLYKDSFNREFNTEGGERNVLGMVGSGVLNREMILSQPSLRESFLHPADGGNTAIHEFAHLLDKADGATDGVPEYLLDKPYIIPWVTEMHKTIREMRLTRKSDINLYGATNEPEFFAVVSEYFFEQPQQLKEHHPELFALLEEMFHVKN